MLDKIHAAPTNHGVFILYLHLNVTPMIPPTSFQQHFGLGLLCSLFSVYQFRISYNRYWICVNPNWIYRIRNNAEQTECFRNNGSTSIHHSTTEGLPGRTNDTLFVYIQPILSIHSLQWARPPCSKPHRPKPNRRWGDILVSLLLLSGNVETNPGPVQQTSPETKTTFGSFNVRSAVHKAALLHDMISENKLDIMALQETWIPPDAPPTIADDIAPPGFTAYHVHRPTRGGGLAIIIRDHFQARPVDVKWKPRLFELQLLRIQLNRKRTLLIANIYQPVSSPSSDFFEELDELFSRILFDPADVLVCGDFNCPGSSNGRVSDRLEDVLISADLEQHVHEPTREHNLLEILATSNLDLVSSTRTVDSCSVSDHRLVIASLDINPAKPEAIRQTFRNLKNFNASEFESALRRSVLFTDPANTVEEFSSQLREVVTIELNKVCPLKTRTCRPSNSTSRWLSEEAKEAKRNRRRLERIWLRTKNETDRLNYRASCRRANILINNSRKKHFSDTLDSYSNPKQRWKTVNNFLHPQSTRNTSANTTSITSTSFLNFFTSKIDKLKQTIVSRIAQFNLPPPLPDPTHSGERFSVMATVTSTEVSKLLNSIQPKSSNLDFIPTSLIKLCSSTFSPLIAHLANLSFVHGVFPSSFKIAQIPSSFKIAHFSRNLNVWCRWQCFNVARVLPVSVGLICEIWSGCLPHNPAQNRCSSGFGSWTHPFHFLHLPHSICHQPVQC